MKTKYTFNFSSVKKTVLEMDIAEVKAFNLNVEILNAATGIWNATPIAERVVKTFRDDFTAQAVEWGFSEEWARKRLASLDFLRMRLSPQKPKAPAAEKAKPAKAIKYLESLKLTPKEWVKILSHFDIA